MHLRLPSPPAFATALLLALASVPAHAYIGPGLGLGAISTALGVVGAILLGIVSLVWYPFKRLIRTARGKSRRQPPKVEK